MSFVSLLESLKLRGSKAASQPRSSYTRGSIIFKELSVEDSHADDLLLNKRDRNNSCFISNFDRHVSPQRVILIGSWYNGSVRVDRTGVSMSLFVSEWKRT